jgi:lysophospholipase L1-like esterase
MNPSYVKPLQRHLGPKGVQVVNAGVSGDLAVNLLDRLNDIVACRPDLITVLIGTNDVAAHINEKWRDGYMRRKRLSELPSSETFECSLVAIVDRLQSDTDAPIALSEIPILGENLGSAENARVCAYNRIVHRVAGDRGLEVLPLFGRLRELLPEQSTVTRFDGSKRWMNRAIRQRFILRRGWDRISEKNGLSLMTDHIHLNERGAQVMVTLVEDFAIGNLGQDHS